MKRVKIPFPVLALGLVISIPFLAFADRFMAKDPVTNYANHCSGCHGTDLKTFTSRTWKFSQSVIEVKEIIQSGMPDYGMPAYQKLFSEKEVGELAELLWAESKKSEKKQSIPVGLDKIRSADQAFGVDTVVQSLKVPWGMAFLPNGDLLITERPGELLVYEANGTLSKVGGVPAVFAKGQGGLLDVELHPNYHLNGWIYLSYSYPNQNGSEGNTAIMRARFNGEDLYDQEVIFTGTPLSRKGVHFGSKLVFDREGFLFFTIGERGNPPNAQLMTNHSGKIHRLHDNGDIPADNPFVDMKGAKKSIYSYGHRNPQGIAMHPETGKIWVHEHGPKGGDEINIIQKGANYGWPVITYGINYDGSIITEKTHQAGMEQPLLYWVPSIAPCGMTFVSGVRYPGWSGDLLVGSLSFTYLHRVDLDGSLVVKEEKLLEKIGRVRDIEMSPDGYVYLAVERPGLILRLIPIEKTGD